MRGPVPLAAADDEYCDVGLSPCSAPGHQEQGQHHVKRALAICPPEDCLGHTVLYQLAATFPPEVLKPPQQRVVYEVAIELTPRPPQTPRTVTYWQAISINHFVVVTLRKGGNDPGGTQPLGRDRADRSQLRRAGCSHSSQEPR